MKNCTDLNLGEGLCIFTFFYFPDSRLDLLNGFDFYFWWRDSENQIPESVKFLLIESDILGFGMRNTAQGIRNPTNDWNPESKFYWQILKSSTWNRESTAWNPESKTVLDSPTWIEAIIAGFRGSLSKFVEHHFDSLPHTEQTNSKSWYITVDNIHRGLRMTPNLFPRAFSLENGKSPGNEAWWHPHPRQSRVFKCQLSKDLNEESRKTG